MFAALTPLLIDLFSEWSVNTAEQTYNGTINQRLEHVPLGARTLHLCELNREVA